MFIILGLIIILILLIYCIWYLNKKSTDFIDNMNDNTIYKYKKDQLPLNIYFANNAKIHTHFKTLFTATQKAISKFNNAFKYEFFVLQKNTTKFRNVVIIQIACGNHIGCSSGFDGNGGIIAHATFPPYRKLCIDCGDIDFSPLHVVLMHEFGHLIGLAHTHNSNIESLMQPHYNKNIQEFTSYDIKRTKKRYPFIDKFKQND